MGKMVIRLPDEFLYAVEAEHLRREQGKADVVRYIQGYLENPETPQELGRARATAHYAFDDESWEEEFDR